MLCWVQLAPESVLSLVFPEEELSLAELEPLEGLALRLCSPLARPPFRATAFRVSAEAA